MKKSQAFFYGKCFMVSFFIFFLSAKAYSYAPAKEFYEIRIYHLLNKDQEDRVDRFLQGAYLPALHRAGISKVGVFKPIGNDTAADRRIYVFFPLKSLTQFLNLPDQLEKDQQFQTQGKEFLTTPYNNPAYKRIETIQLEAFPEAPVMQMPDLHSPKSERVYELRSYESPTEKLHINKVKMFNKGGEVKLFKRLGFNAVFYARVIAGANMPNLMYMTTFENLNSREEHWKAFTSDPEWKTLSAMPEYKNNVSKSDKFFLYPTEYSDI